eukprot:g21254.t1
MEVHPCGVYRKTGSYYYGSKAVEVVRQYKYLGFMLTDTLSWDAQHERAQRLAKGTWRWPVCFPEVPLYFYDYKGGKTQPYFPPLAEPQPRLLAASGEVQRQGSARHSTANRLPGAAPIRSANKPRVS